MTEIIHNTTMAEALRRQDAISKALKAKKEQSEIIKELKEAGIELETYKEPVGYPNDRNMI